MSGENGILISTYSMPRVAELVRRVTHTTEVGLPRFSPEERTTVLTDAKRFVAEARHVAPESGVDKNLFQAWIPKVTDYASPERIGGNPHAYHNLRHIASVVGEEMFLLPYAEAVYADNLDRPLLPRAVYASAAGHDLFRKHDIWGAIPDSLYKVHGEQMAEEVRSGKRFSALSSLERSVAAQSIQYHDVDSRNPSARNPEDELLSLVDRGEIARLVYGVGFWPRMGRAAAHFGHNPFEKQQQSYKSHYFPGLAEKIQPLSKAMLILSLEGMKKGLGQAESVWYAMQELGMVKDASQKLAAA